MAHRPGRQLQLSATPSSPDDNHSPLSNLPRDLFSIIVNLTDLRTATALRLTCKGFRECVDMSFAGFCADPTIEFTQAGLDSFISSFPAALAEKVKKVKLVSIRHSTPVRHSIACQKGRYERPMSFHDESDMYAKSKYTSAYAIKTEVLESRLAVCLARCPKLQEIELNDTTPWCTLPKKISFVKFDNWSILKLALGLAASNCRLEKLSLTGSPCPYHADFTRDNKLGLFRCSLVHPHHKRCIFLYDLFKIAPPLSKHELRPLRNLKELVLQTTHNGYNFCQDTFVSIIVQNASKLEIIRSSHPRGDGARSHWTDTQVFCDLAKGAYLPKLRELHLAHMTVDVEEFKSFFLPYIKTLRKVTVHRCLLFMLTHQCLTRADDLIRIFEEMGLNQDPSDPKVTAFQLESSDLVGAWDLFWERDLMEDAN